MYIKSSAASLARSSAEYFSRNLSCRFLLNLESSVRDRIIRRAFFFLDMSTPSSQSCSLSLYTSYEEHSSRFGGGRIRSDTIVLVLSDPRLPPCLDSLFHALREAFNKKKH